MKPLLLRQVRNACKTVSERAKFIKINHDRIASYAISLMSAHVSSPELDPGRHYLGHGDHTVAFLVTLDAVNFGSGYFPHLRKRPGMSGYFTVASSLTDYYKEHGPLSARELLSIRAEDCARIFGQEIHDEPVRELMQLFSTAWNDLGRFLLDHFDGRFSGLIEAAASSAERLVELLAQMPYFNDVELYDNLSVPFFKRAQLTAADLFLAFSGEGPGRFEDLHELTIFADNLVPHVLRMDGILLYDEALAARIDAEEPIPAFSPEEIEIRACAVHAVELIRETLQESGYAITAMNLDYLLWNRGQDPFYKKTRPRHRTRTVFY